MIYITEKAKNRIKQLKIEENLDESYFLRVSVIGGGCSGLSYKLDFDNKIKNDDEEFTEEDEKVVTNFKSLLYICDSTLDYSDGLNGKGFHFINPNATRSCGCGESFAI